MAQLPSLCSRAGGPTTTEPVLQSRGDHNYRACAPEPGDPQLLSLCSRAGGPQLPSLCSRAGGPQLLSLCSRAGGPQLLRLCSRAGGPTTAEPECPRFGAAQQEEPPQREAHSLQLESDSRLPQLEKSPPSNEDPAQPKINNFF